MLDAPRGCVGRGSVGGGTDEAGAAGGEVDESGGGGDKAEGSASCGRTVRGAPGQLRPSQPGPCGEGWPDEGCAR